MKYFKPKSLTWWSGFAALAAGALVAAGDSFGVATGAAAFIDALTGDLAPSVMVLWGLTAIGIRGALK